MTHQFTSFQKEVFNLINFHFGISTYNLTFDDDLSITFKNGINEGDGGFLSICKRCVNVSASILLSYFIKIYNLVSIKQ